MHGSNHLCINGTSSSKHANDRNEEDISSKYYDPELNRQRRNSRERSSSHDKDSDHKNSNKGIYPRSSSIVGPTLPTQQDLQLQKEHLAEQADEARHIHTLERKSQRRLEKERLEELVPRSDAGTRERRLEKRAETNAANRSFREKSPDVGVPDATLMGGDDVRAELMREKRREAEREARREEIARGREAERLKRRSDLEKREDGTMEMLKKLAEERWGRQG
jgi:hypothetical protein